MAKRKSGADNVVRPAAALHDLALRWQRWTVWPMFILSVVFVALQLSLLFYSKSMRPWEYALAGLSFLILWFGFILDFLIRLFAQPNRKKYLKERWFELVVLFIPLLRPALPLYYLWRTPYFNRGTAEVLRQRYMITVASIAVLFLYLVSTAVYLVEHSAPGANIKTWGDAMWWGIVTITTVGYGDVYPVTFSGRMLGSVMMVVGLLLIGVVSGSFVSYLAQKVKDMTVKHTISEREAEQQAENRASSLATSPSASTKTQEWAVAAAAEVKEALQENKQKEGGQDASKGTS